MIIIDELALLDNAQYFRKIIGKKCKLCAVVKCNAYNHGLLRCAVKLAKKVDMFAVSNIDEADKISLLSKPILLLMPLDSLEMETAVSRGYRISVESVATAQRLASLKNKSKRKPIVHIKIDSGMSRLGASIKELKQIVDIIHPISQVEGIFSHFASSDSDVAFCDVQYNYFAKCCKLAERLLGYMPIRHIANTMATLTDSKYHLDMVRIGLGLYGYANEQLSIVKSVVGRVVSVKNLCAGSKVGYNTTVITTSDTNIAIVDLGYYYGIPQCNGYLVSVGDKQYPVIGKTNMAMIIIDTQSTLLTLFDKVTIIGNNTTIHTSGYNSIYEILCNTR